MGSLLESLCNDYRKQLKVIELQIRELMHSSELSYDETFAGQRGEQKGHIMLAVRCVEDARMRLGKVIQYNGDGISCYDK